jgi:hypothetical protein
MSFDLEKILPIIIPVLTFVLGMFVEYYRIKNSNIREKAKVIDEGTMKDLKTRANEVKKHIDEENFISFREGNMAATLIFNKYEYVNILEDSNIFTVKDGKISLIYQKDRILKKHANIIIQNLKIFQSETYSLKDMIENLNKSNIPPKFEENLRSLLEDEFGGDCLDTEKRLKEFLFISYVISISGSKNSYKSGRSYIVDIIEKRYDDLQYIGRSNPKSNDTFSIIQNNLSNIRSCLNNLVTEIENLHEEWQNEFII